MACLAAVAGAQPPVCFPERTVLWSSLVFDDEGTAFAGLRAGQVVRVLADDVGPNADQADIEITGPVSLRGRVYKHSLLAFAREEIAIVPGESWLITEAPLWIVSGDSSQATVRRAEPHGELPRLPDARATCAQLRGTPQARLTESDCSGAHGASPAVAQGTPVEFNAAPELVTASGMRLNEERTDFHLIEQRGDQALLEYVDDYFEWARIRAYASAAGMHSRRPDGSGHGYGHLCCEGRLPPAFERHEPAHRLLRSVPIRASTGGPVLGTLPKGGVVQVLARFHGDLLVVHESKVPGRRWTGVAVRAWVPAPAVSGPRKLPASISGRFAFPEGLQATTQLEVSARAGHQPWMRGRAFADGHYEVPAVNEDQVEILGVSSDRTLVGSFKPMTRGDDFVLHLRPTREIAGVVTTQDGHAIPGARLYLHSWNYGGPLTAHADVAGRFTLRSIFDRGDFLYVSAPGFLERSVHVVDGVAATVPLTRSVVIGGAVARDAAGRCTEQNILFIGEQDAKVRPDCTFEIEREHEGVVTAVGRRSRGGSITISAKGESPAASSCMPDGKNAARESSASLRCNVVGDSLDLCINGNCVDRRPASIFVRVVTPAGGLAPDVRIEAANEARKLGDCRAPSGACFIHGLPVNTKVTLSTQLAGRRLQAVATTSANAVVEVTLH